MALVNCAICKDKTSDAVPYDKDKNDVKIFVCSPCKGKFGGKTRKKLNELGWDLGETIKEMVEEPFKCNLKYSGGNKMDRINLILNIMDSEEISMAELERHRW